MTKGMMKALTSKARPAPPESGCSDLLLRFFESQFFSAWIAIQCVPGAADAACVPEHVQPCDQLSRALPPAW